MLWNRSINLTLEEQEPNLIYKTSDFGSDVYSAGAFDYELGGKRNYTVFGTADSRLYAYYPNGTMLWNRSINLTLEEQEPNLIYKTGELANDIYSVGYFDYDLGGKRNYTVFGDSSGRIFAYYPNGTLLWNRSINLTVEEPEPNLIYKTDSLTDDVYSAGVFDYELGGKRNYTVFGGQTGEVRAYYPNGTLLWNRTINYTEAEGYPGKGLWNTTDLGSLYSVGLLDYELGGKRKRIAE